MSELTRDHPGKFGRVICVWYYLCTRLVQSMIYSVQNEKQIVGKVLGCCTVIPVNWFTFFSMIFRMSFLLELYSEVNNKFLSCFNAKPFVLSVYAQMFFILFSGFKKVQFPRSKSQ